jgi:hypothetical protein
MPLFTLDVQKELRGEYWTNRYVLDGVSLLALTAPANAIVAAERAITLGDVRIVSYRISDRIAGGDVYIVQPVGVLGQRTVATQALPLFDVARVDFSVGQGRPSRKYLRGVLAEGDQTNYGELELTTVQFIDDNYANIVSDVPEYVDVDGQQIAYGRCYPYVGMRQLRRGSKRRSQPIIPVG